MNKWKKILPKSVIEKIIENLKSRGIEAFLVESGEDAKKKILEIIPQGASVLTSASVTLETTGIRNEIDESGKFVSVRKEYMVFDREKDADKIRISRSTPDIIIGSVHAITKKGEILIASNTGSQLAPYVSSAGKVIWVVGAQKIVESLDEGFKRVYEYALPLESEKLMKAYGVPSNVSKLLIFNKEVVKDRVTLIFVNEVLGF
jgi:L-lactate utilization protein LutC